MMELNSVMTFLAVRIFCDYLWEQIDQPFEMIYRHVGQALDGVEPCPGVLGFFGEGYFWMRS